MDSRALHVYTAMKRIADVIERDPHLKARAAESRAYERFVGEIAAFDELAASEKQAKISRPLLRKRFEDMAAVIMIELKCIDGADRLSGAFTDRLGSLHKPGKDMHVWQFTAGVQGYLMAMEAQRERLVDAGLHPNKFDDARTLLVQFEETHDSWSRADSAIQVAPQLLKLWVDRAQKRGKLLHNELYSAMSKEALAKWSVAASLGRAHRPHALGPVSQRALPAPQKPESPHRAQFLAQAAQEPAPGKLIVSSVSRPSLGTRVRAVLRAFGGSDGDASGLVEPRRAIEGIKPLAPAQGDASKDDANAA